MFYAEQPHSPFHVKRMIFLLEILILQSFDAPWMMREVNVQGLVIPC